MVRELQEGVGIISGLTDDFAAFDGSNLREQGTQKIFGYRSIQIPYIQGPRMAFLAHYLSWHNTLFHFVSILL